MMMLRVVVMLCLLACVMCHGGMHGRRRNGRGGGGNMGRGGGGNRRSSNRYNDFSDDRQIIDEEVRGAGGAGDAAGFSDLPEDYYMKGTRDVDAPSSSPSFHPPPPPPPPPTKEEKEIQQLLKAVLMKNLKSTSTEQNINLKISGQVDMIKSFKDGGHHHHHGMAWYKNAAEFHKHLHEQMDREDGEEDGAHSKENCPFHITTQLLKLCKCKVVNKRMSSVLGKPFESFPNDPMQVFNNTPGLEELKTGQMNALMDIVTTLDDKNQKKLFFYSLIRSLCRSAKNFVEGVEKFEQKLKERTRSKAAVAVEPVPLDNSPSHLADRRKMP